MQPLIKKLLEEALPDGYWNDAMLVIEVKKKLEQSLLSLNQAWEVRVREAIAMSLPKIEGVSDKDFVLYYVTWNACRQEIIKKLGL